MTKEEKKKQAALAAIAYLKDGMHIGLGSGTTVNYFLQALQQRCAKGLQIRAMASSLCTQQWAKQYQIPLLADTYVQTLDVYVDSFDVLNHHGDIIKGGGGALVREKMLFQWADKTIWICDDEKLVDDCHCYALPVEVLPFTLAHTRHMLNEHGYKTSLRMAETQPFLTDNQHYILDVFVLKQVTLAQAHTFLMSFAAIVQTGYFHDEDNLCIIASSKGVCIHPVRDV